MITFTNVGTIKGGIKKIGGADSEVTDSIFVNLIKKWYAPIAMGVATLAPTYLWKRTYQTGLTLAQNAFVGGKPFLFTEEAGHLIAYTLDYHIPINAQRSVGGGNFQTIVVNPDVDNDGNDKIKRLDGGELTDSGVGTTWTVIDSEGKVLSPTNTDVLANAPMSVDLPVNNPQRYPCPMILLVRPSS